MDVIASKALDHHGLVAGIISDLGLAKLIDSRLPKDKSTKISNGQAVAAMLVNGLGFTSRPLSLTPQFFSSKAVDVLFGEDVNAADFNRHRLGRCLDDIYRYGCDTLFSELGHRICLAEHIDNRFVSLDTSSFKVTGEYDVDTDENEINMTHGFSKDHRPDLKQVVLELLVSQDGGVPLMSKCFDGNAPDSTIFKSRCASLVKQFKEGEAPRYLVADSKLYDKNNAHHLTSLSFITRIPRTHKLEQASVCKAIEENTWEKIDSDNKYHVYNLEHYGMHQRWLVVYSEAAHRRAHKSLKKQVEKEAKQIKATLKHLRNEHYNCASDAEGALLKLNKSLKYHQLVDQTITPKAHYASQGRPKSDEQATHVSYIPQADIEEDKGRQVERLNEKSCYVIGTNIAMEQLSDSEVIEAYKNQNAAVERGFRFLKDPYFFVSSFFIKKPSRIMALLMVMTLALVVYSVAQRKLRQALEKTDEALPNQISVPTKKPTLRWVFQLLEGINVVYMKVNGKIKKVITGLDDLKIKIINLFSRGIKHIYLPPENDVTWMEM